MTDSSDGPEVADPKETKNKKKGKEKKGKKENGESENDKDSCFKCLRCLVITLTIILFIVSLGILGVGVVIMVKEDLLLGKFKETIESKIPKEAASAVPEGKAKFKALSSLLQSIAVILIALGVAFVVLCMFFFIIACCCWRKRKCLICFLVFIILLAIGQIVLVVILVEGSLPKGAINSKLSVIMVKEHEKNQILIFGIQTKFLCCGVFGSKDYFCKGIYDLRCNKGCAIKKAAELQKVSADNPNIPDIDLCPVDKRSPLDASSLTVCSVAKEFALVASSDFRFAEFGGENSKFDEKTVKDPGCGEALWKEMYVGYVGMISLAGFILLLELLAAFFACYSVAKRKGKEQEKIKSDAKNKVKDISIQTSLMEDKASQTKYPRSPSPGTIASAKSLQRPDPAAVDSGSASNEFRRASPLIQSSPVHSGTNSSPPGYVQDSQFPESIGRIGSDSSVEIQTNNGVWYQKSHGTWNLELGEKGDYKWKYERN